MVVFLYVCLYHMYVCTLEPSEVLLLSSTQVDCHGVFSSKTSETKCVLSCSRQVEEAETFPQVWNLQVSLFNLIEQYCHSYFYKNNGCQWCTQG